MTKKEIYKKVISELQKHEMMSVIGYASGLKYYRVVEMKRVREALKAL